MVQGQDQERLGKIENLAIDQDTGKIRYAVVSFGGTLGFGGKLVPVPWHALTFVSTARPGEAAATVAYYVLSANKDALAKAPSFERGQWPDFSDQKWQGTIDQFFRPYMAKKVERRHPPIATDSAR